VIVSVAPREELNVTLAPCTGLLLASNTVTVMVLVVIPSATTLVGFDITVEVAPSGEPAVKVTGAVWEMLTPAATALITALPAVVEATVPVVCPAASVTETGCVIVSVGPLEELKVTLTPGTGLLLASSTVTVITLVSPPSASTLKGLAETVEVPPLMGPGTKVIVVVCIILTPDATALIKALPVVVEVTVPVV
jgi:hypothetical protein